MKSTNKTNKTNTALCGLISGLLVTFVATVNTASAGLIMTAYDINTGNQLAYAGTLLANDLVNQGTTTFLNAVQTNYTAFPGADPANTVLNNGNIGGISTFSGTPGQAMDPDGVFTVTYNLNLATATAGYDLTRIRSYAAHLGHRTAQNYTVRVDFVNDGLGNFVSLGNFFGSNPTGDATRMTLENNLNPGVDAFASGVGAIEFTTAIPSFDPVVWREFDVEGFAVPEPASAALLLGSGAMLLLRRRRPAV